MSSVIVKNFFIVANSSQKWQNSLLQIFSQNLAQVLAIYGKILVRKWQKIFFKNGTLCVRWSVDISRHESPPRPRQIGVQDENIDLCCSLFVLITRINEKYFTLLQKRFDRFEFARDNKLAVQTNQSNQSGVYIMTASKVKPSQAHGNEDILRAKAAEANRKRAQRKREQAWEEAEERASQEREAEERARQEAEEARIREEEAKMWEQAQAKPKAEKKAYKQGKIKTRVDGVEFDSLAKAMASVDPVLWGRENDYRTSCWIKINRALKKDGSVVYGGHTYELAI